LRIEALKPRHVFRHELVNRSNPRAKISEQLGRASAVVVVEIGSVAPVADERCQFGAKARATSGGYANAGFSAGT